MRVLISITLLFLLNSASLRAQHILPYDSARQLVVLKGSHNVDVKSKKKVTASIRKWLGEKQIYPPMVFSLIHESKNHLVAKGVTEIPSKKALHPISFKIDFFIGRKAFYYEADNFYFEDIKLSLEDWLGKYADSGNERNRQNVEMVSKEIESYLFLSMADLTEQINEQ